MKIGIIGAGTMGTGISQVSSEHGFETLVYEMDKTTRIRSKDSIHYFLKRKTQKGQISISEEEEILKRIHYVNDLEELHQCDLILEAIIEAFEIKKEIFNKLESIVSRQCILATNTSSLSITSLAASCSNPDRFIGMHFFNPAPLMKLVEVIPAIQTKDEVKNTCLGWVSDLGKTAVIAKDTPGFIVNKVARPFYSEAIRIAEEGIANYREIDYAMTEIGGFRMGPFTLMDLIGNDVNYKVTESVWKSFYYDPRYKPSFTQKRLVEAGYLGRKTGKGFFNYTIKDQNTKTNFDKDHLQVIFKRILIMLINEAADTLFLNIATTESIDLAMKLGVGYPKGMLQWADEIGIKNCVKSIDELYDLYHEDRYRCSPILRKMALNDQKFYS